MERNRPRRNLAGKDRRRKYLAEKNLRGKDWRAKDRCPAGKVPITLFHTRVEVDVIIMWRNVQIKVGPCGEIRMLHREIRRLHYKI